MDIDKLWKDMHFLGHLLGLRPAINWNEMLIGIGRLNYTLPEFRQLMDVELWRPLV